MKYYIYQHVVHPRASKDEKKSVSVGVCLLEIKILNH